MPGLPTTTPARLRASVSSLAMGRPSRYGVRSVTQAGRWAMGMSLVVAALGFLRGDVWMYFIALLGMAAFAISWFVVPRLPQLEMRLVAPAVEIVGAPTFAQLVVRAGAARAPRQHVTVHAVGDTPGDRPGDLPRGVHALLDRMGAGETQTLDLVLHPRIRGHHDGYVALRWTTAPFGLVRRTTASSGSRHRTVSAGIAPSRVPPATRLGDGTAPRVRIGRDGTDVHALRGWSSGDASPIHWRTTARRNVPVVVDRETPEVRSLVVVAGPAPTEESADEVVARAAGMALTAAHEGADVHVVAAQGATAVGRNDEDALEQWAAVAQPATPVAEAADLAVQLAGPQGRIAVVHGRGARSDEWAAAASSQGVDVVDVVVDPTAPVPLPEPPVPTLERRLALATLASLVGGVLCVGATGALSGSGAVTASLVLVAVAVVALLRPLTFVDARARSAVSLALLALTAVLGVHFVVSDAATLAPPAVVGLCGVAAAQLVGARTRRDGLVALGLGPLLVIVAAGLAPGPALVLPALVVAVSVLLGLASCADGALLEGVPEARRAAPAAPVAPVVAVVSLAVVSFLLLPLGSAASFGTSLLGDHPTAPTPAQQAAQLQPSYFSGVLDLGSRGHLPDTTALEVAPGAPGLWRAMTLDIVDHGVWSGESMAQTTFDARSGLVTLPADPGDAGAPRGVAKDYQVRPEDSSSLVAPGVPQSVTGIETLLQLQRNAFVANGLPVPYTVSAVPIENVDDLRSAASGPDRSEPVYTTLDPTTTLRTENLAATIAGGATDRVAVVRAVESWLRANIRYQLDAPLPPDDQNAVDFLLFESKAGFCEHFAAAEATLLRSLGIPSRLATGYAVGSGTTTTDGWTVVKDSDAHAWVEVWIPGHGWVSSDPTAGSALADANAGANPAQRVLLAWNSLWTSDSGRRLLAVALLVLVALAAVVTAWLRRRRRSDLGGRLASAHGSMPEPLAAFARMRAALAADGAGGGPGDGVGEARRASQADPDLLQALDVVERTLYDRAKPSAEQRLAAADLIDARTAALLARASVPV